VTFLGEGLGDDARALAGAAVRDDFLVTDLGEKVLPLAETAGIELAFGEEHRRRGHTGLEPLGGFADINEDRLTVGNTLRGLGRSDVFHGEEKHRKQK